jgi:hypothetical protein
VNRRGYLKTLVSVGIVGASSFSVFKWIDSHKSIGLGKLWDKRELIAEIAEMIIPETDTPGARTAGVDLYIIEVMLNCNPAVQQHKFYTGLEEVELHASNTYNQHFLKCTSPQKQAILQHFSEKAVYSNRILNKISNKIFGQSFFSTIKNLTVEGYCFSKKGATEGLNYDYVPGRFEACIPLQPNQKSWATK